MFGVMKRWICILGLLTASLHPALAQRKGYWQQAVDYKMEIDVDHVKFQYNGKMRLAYTNNSGQKLNKVYFHLYYNAFQPGSMMDHRLQHIVDPDSRMATNKGTKEKPNWESRIAQYDSTQIGYQKIHSIKYNNQPVSYKIDGTILEVTLNQPLLDQSTATFDIEWLAQVPEITRRGGKNTKEGIDFSMTQWYPKMAQFDEFGWHLDEYIGREFIAPFGNFDVTINIDKNYVIGASGVLQNTNQVKGYDPNVKIAKKTKKVNWHFKAENIHDFAWAADPDFIVDSAKSKDGVTVYGVFQPKDAENETNWRKSLDYAAQFFDYTGERFGKYPWPTYTVVQGGDGGMEYGTVTLITGHRPLNSLVGVIYHEAAHSWFQHLFGINETVDEWFDEGFTSYVETFAYNELFLKKKSEAANPFLSQYKSYIRLANSGKEEPMSLLADYYNTNYAYSNQAYSKGCVLAEQLGYIIGQENLDQTFLKFYDNWKFKHPTPNDFKRVAEEVSGINLKWYFNLFINTTRKIDYGVEKVVDNQIFIKNKSDFAMPLDVLVTYADGSTELFYIPLREMRSEKPAESFDVYNGAKRTVLPNTFWTNPNYSFSIDKNKQIQKVTIDPTKRLADVHDTDNTWEMK